MNDIIKKLKRSNLVGRGGACFPVADKWEMVKKSAAKRKFVVCNASEGEPGVRKDLYILKNFPGQVISGMKLAIDWLGAEKGILYLNPAYYDQLAEKLEKLCQGANIYIFRKPEGAGYIGGEETSALNTIEGVRSEPRIRPPFPLDAGLWGCPTLVNNVETFYDVCLIAAGKYEHKRFFTVNGDCLWPGVFEFAEETKIRDVLYRTENLPDFDFFIQVGGDASGIVLDQSQADAPASGSASITVFSKIKHDPIRLMRKWISFFCDQSCGKCTPCREGTYRLLEIIDQKNPDWLRFSAILDALAGSSFCGLGCSVPTPIRSYVENVLALDKKRQINLSDGATRAICSCFE